MGLWHLSCSSPAQNSCLHCGWNVRQPVLNICHLTAILLLLSSSLSFVASHSAQPQGGPDPGSHGGHGASNTGSHGGHGASNPLPPASHPVGSAKLAVELLQHLHETLEEPWDASEGRASSQAHEKEKSLDSIQPHIVSPKVKTPRRQLGESHVTDTGLRQPLSLSEYWLGRKNSSGPWPKVYLYKLPPVFKDDTFFGGSMANYAAEKTAPEWLQMHGHVVEDPDEADLFLVDAWFYNAMYRVLGQLGDCLPPDSRPHLRSCAVLHAFRIIRAQLPYFERSGGLDHIWILTQDHGFCGFLGAGEMYLPEISKGIIASHWGLVKSEMNCDLMSRLRKGFCQDMWLAQGRRPAGLTVPCYVPGKDVLLASSYIDEEFHDVFAGFNRIPILPPDVDPSWPLYTNQTLMCASPPLIKAGNPTVHMYPNRPRDLQLYFAGTIGLDVPRYSHGVRQTVANIFGLNDTHPGWMIVAGDDPHYGPRFANSRFCLAASGAGWGVRFKVALMCGCIPLVISDYVELENSDVFRLEDISIRLPESYIYALPDALDYIERHFPEKLRVMQRRIACAWRYWVWTEPYGRAGEAFACSLRRKLMGHDRLIPRMDWNTCTLSCG